MRKHLEASGWPFDDEPLPPEPPAHLTQRAAIFLDTLDHRHAAGQHPHDGHLFCRSCRPSYARLSLLRRLVLDPRFDPLTIDMTGSGWRFADGTTDLDGDDTWRLQSIEELRALAAPEMLIDGVLPAKSYGILSGRDGTYKTFTSLDWGCTLAAGLDAWRGRDVGPEEPSTVYLLAGEGAGQIPARVDAWAEHNGVDPDALSGLRILPRVPDLYTGGPGFEAVLEQARRDQPVLIVVDTLRRASGPADQNSSRDMGLVVDRLHALQEASGGTVLVIAHTDKGDNDTRGASSIEDDADFVVHVKRKDEPLRQEMTVTKMKDAADDFRLTTYPVSVGASIVLADEPDEVPVAWSSTSPRSRVIGALRSLAPKGLVSQAEIKAVVDDDGHDEMNRGTVSKQIARLIEEGAVVKDGQRYGLVEGWEETL